MPFGELFEHPACTVVLYNFWNMHFKVLDAREVFMHISMGIYITDWTFICSILFWTMIKGKKSILDQFGQSLYCFRHEILKTFYLEIT